MVISATGKRKQVGGASGARGGKASTILAWSGKASV